MCSGPDHRSFADGDVFAEKLRRAAHIKIVIEEAKEAARQQCVNGNDEDILSEDGPAYQMKERGAIGFVTDGHLMSMMTRGKGGN